MLIPCLVLGKAFILDWTAEKTGSHPTESPPWRPCPPLRSDRTTCSMPSLHTCLPQPGILLPPWPRQSLSSRPQSSPRGMLLTPSLTSAGLWCPRVHIPWALFLLTGSLSCPGWSIPHHPLSGRPCLHSAVSASPEPWTFGTHCCIPGTWHKRKGYWALEIKCLRMNFKEQPLMLQSSFLIFHSTGSAPSCSEWCHALGSPWGTGRSREHSRSAPEFKRIRQNLQPPTP